MPVRFYMDVHIPAAVIQQLRIRGVDFLAATEERTNRLSDAELLELATKQVASSLPMTFVSVHWLNSNNAKEKKSEVFYLVRPNVLPSVSMFVTWS